MAFIQNLSHLYMCPPSFERLFSSAFHFCRQMRARKLSQFVFLPLSCLLWNPLTSCPVASPNIGHTGIKGFPTTSMSKEAASSSPKFQGQHTITRRASRCHQS
ncbi:hypothetical protein M378DRAFT_132667 [Amanita muscaria Koide BX008]|uniref:Uncharacterized protein n=1 Tax=Amanita muscaria (strain Koide BX008) TaxID=946122 RepID=A0A0C2WAK7_AMAMK|nr:hypothetical protein M378DRAFT_132667 [Amanita muscaria Koide BX008]